MVLDIAGCAPCLWVGSCVLGAFWGMSLHRKRWPFGPVAWASLTGSPETSAGLGSFLMWKISSRPPGCVPLQSWSGD